ncbi:hypothetical protein CBR_g918 [Chara braunii]|uniref:Uncharacterized protein n=1 Tax=Chara braunii TaxID=69332 RepID=A0A388KCK0_CHABU|nr:hypothetical protein CBR_g918 [Chara braunii]|eukprot:GBG67794.1 hypothetical protein CBR_g918 [Chara braunii]
MEAEPVIQGERDGRAQVPSDYRLEEERAREMFRACYEEGILPTDIDPGEMEVTGREVKFILNSTLDEIKIKWLKERSVTVIFRDGARFLPKKVKEDVVCAYEDVWISGETLGQDFKRSIIHVESPNVVSYVPRAQVITDWMLRMKTDLIDLVGTTYRTDFKPWLTRAEIRDWRQLINQDTLWVVAVGVPLHEMSFLHVHVEKAIGKVLKQHKPEADESDLKLVNLRFDIDPTQRANMKDKITVQICQGDMLEVKLADAYTAWCKRCRTFFHTKLTCKRTDRLNQGEAHSNQHQASSAPTAVEPRPGYVKVSAEQVPPPSQQPAASSKILGGASIRSNPAFSPGVIPVQPTTRTGVVQGQQNYPASTLEAAWVAYLQGLPSHPFTSTPYGMSLMNSQLGMSPSISNLHAFIPWNKGMMGLPQGNPPGRLFQHGTSPSRLSQAIHQVNPSPFRTPTPSQSGFRQRGESPRKQRRLSNVGIDIRVDDMHVETSDSSNGSQSLVIVTGKRK